ncbi:hypothetical protein [Nocardioides sp. cx-173]|uniref:hypothetical protein n=1 Tax=Nocardioides sp. cx-173 TaxID=2898796 RepID=UPI001E638C92|nr:hypothetical protein [Nocardioides sp. cx-173]MCD4523625.1 hypothetical protein [Nocardioides sp. cx-173]UGB42040.1 hypothetical protein LQ940_00565 [Nocardioides sp. cx-173]
MTATRRVFLHVGAPKTGTTYVQNRLMLNARSLAEHDVHFPARMPRVDASLFHFRAALDLLDQDWGGPPGHAKGNWDALVRRVRRRSGTVVISHEILAPAPVDAIRRAKRDLAGSEIHIVYSARDLARQIPAAWQESVKQGRKWTYRRYLDRIEHGKPWFYRAFDLPNVLSAWGAGLDPAHVHIVTVPPSGAPADELWLRFCRVLGIDPAWTPEDSDRVNESLGVAETQVIRQLNRRMDRATRRESTFDELIREMLAQNELVGRISPSVRMPPRLLPWAQDETGRWVEWIEQSGVDVVGDVADLTPLPLGEDETFVDPDKVSVKQQLRVSMDALAAMTREAARRRDPDQALLRKVRNQAKRIRE